MRTSIYTRYATSLILLILTTLVFSNPAYSGSMHHKVAKSYGLESFGQIDSIRYTFNVKTGDKHVIRSWVWEPGRDQVTFLGKDKSEPFTYNRNALNESPSDKLKKIDHWFINDQYWLLFPLHLAWDDKAKIEDTGQQNLPMGNGNATRILVTYPATGGYTPGDVYELFIDENHKVKQWIFRRGGSPKPTLTATWEDHKQVGPLTVSTNHVRDDGKFRLYFTDVAVKLTGSDQWVEAK